jgi:hypothetical protein
MTVLAELPFAELLPPSDQSRLHFLSQLRQEALLSLRVARSPWPCVLSSL